MVVAIIALLVAILLPSLSRAQTEARRIACAANLKTIGGAIAIYTNEHKWHFPGPCWNGQHAEYNKGAGLLAGHLAPILGTPVSTGSTDKHVSPIFLDPGANTVAPTHIPLERVKLYGAVGDDMAIHNPPFGAMRRFFGYPDFNGNPEVKPKKITDLEHPSTVKALHDIDHWSNPGGWAPSPGLPSQVLLAPAHGSPDEVHAVRNFLYYDWHVEVELVQRKPQSY